MVKKSKYGIGFKLSIIFSLISVFTLTVMSVFSYNTQKKAITDSLLREISLKVEKTVIDVEGWFLQRSSIIDGLACIYSDQENYNTVTSLSRSLNPLLTIDQESSLLDTLYIGAEDSGIFYTGLDWIPDEGWDPRTRPWYSSAKSSGTSIFTDYYTDAITGQFIITIASPMYNENNKFIGVLGTDIFFDEILHSTQSHQTEDIEVALIDSKGSVIVHPDKELVNTNLLENSELSDVFTKVLEQKKGSQLYRFDVEEKLMAYDKIPSTNWEVLYFVNTKLIKDPLRKLLISYLLITIIALVITVMLSIYVANLFAKRIINVADTLRDISAGNLAVNIDKTDINKQDEIADLKTSLVSMVEKLGDVIYSVTSSSKEIASASTELATGNQQLSSRTEEQAAALEETSSAIEELNSSIRSDADRTTKATEHSMDVLERTKEGAVAVEQMITSMNDISDSSNKIGNIIEVINNIAFQTNLLALNASIEAARAGEQGKGFAVVAVEVRKLAKRSDKAAAEVTEIIKESNLKVSDGVKIANTAGEVLNKINNAVNKVSTIIEDISTSAHEQLSGVDQIDITLGTLDTDTQKNAALVTEAAAATEELSAQAIELSKTMEYFKLKQRELEENYAIVSTDEYI